MKSTKSLQSNIMGIKTQPSFSLFIPALILCISAVLGGLPPIAIKVALRQLDSSVIMFLRVSIMLPVFFLLSIGKLSLLRKHMHAIWPVALGWAGNMVLFSIGIPHTSAALSQVLYTAVPVVATTLGIVVLRERPTLMQSIGIGIGFLGTLIAIQASGVAGGNGTFFGNGFVFAAVISWSLYVIASRKYKNIVPTEVILFIGSCIAWVYFGSVLLVSGTSIPWATISASTIWALLFLGLIGGVIMFFTHQWAAQRLPVVMSGSTGYVSVISGIIGANIVLRESLTTGEWLGLGLILAAVMCTTTIPLILRKRAK
jgi:drug/metabolite transporter (DMT)-like permease